MLTFFIFNKLIRVNFKNLFLDKKIHFENILVFQISINNSKNNFKNIYQNNIPYKDYESEFNFSQIFSFFPKSMISIYYSDQIS
jgi:hypothetical protein